VLVTLQRGFKALQGWTESGSLGQGRIDWDQGPRAQVAACHGCQSLAGAWDRTEATFMAEPQHDPAICPGQPASTGFVVFTVAVSSA
jgi:hypothetical protein